MDLVIHHGGTAAELVKELYDIKGPGAKATRARAEAALIAANPILAPVPVPPRLPGARGARQPAKPASLAAKAAEPGPQLLVVPRIDGASPKPDARPIGLGIEGMISAIDAALEDVRPTLPDKDRGVVDQIHADAVALLRSVRGA
jgi:hypothetical protein